MRPVIVILICIALTASAASAGTGMYIAEIGIGTAAGFGGCMLAASAVTSVSSQGLSNEGVGLAIGGIICSQVLTTTAGVWLTGEFIGDGSDNRWTVLWPALGGSALGILPMYGIAVATLTANEGSEYGAFGLMLGSFITGPVVSTVFYNVFREPRVRTVETGYDVRPYTNLLANNGAGSVPVYGLSVSF
jgi:hypothetical protein